MYGGVVRDGEAMNKFKVERKTIKAARMAAVQRRLEAAIAATGPDLWQRFAEQQEGEPVTMSFTRGDPFVAPSDPNITEGDQD